MPDNPRGFVHRTRGLQPPDPHLADCYRANMKSETVFFNEEMIALMVEIARNAGKFINATVHGCGAERSHIHIMVSWNHDREYESMRASIRSAMSRALNQTFGKREWFSDSPSRKRVRDHEHFDYLVLEYLPRHSFCSVRDDDRVAAESRDALRPVSVRDRAKRRRSRKTK